MLLSICAFICLVLIFQCTNTCQFASAEEIRKSNSTKEPTPAELLSIAVLIDMVEAGGLGAQIDGIQTKEELVNFVKKFVLDTRLPTDLENSSNSNTTVDSTDISNDSKKTDVYSCSPDSDCCSNGESTRTTLGDCKTDYTRCNVAVEVAKDKPIAYSEMKRLSKRLLRRLVQVLIAFLDLPNYNGIYFSNPIAAQLHIKSTAEKIRMNCSKFIKSFEEWALDVFDE